MSVPGPAPVKEVEISEEPRRSSFAALRHRDFRLLWLGQLISGTGSQMQLVAINWHVYILTRSPLALGIVGLVRVVPIIICSLVGGVVADAVNRKRLMLITQSAMLISAAVLALVTQSGLKSVWPLYLLTAISSAATAFDNPARQALMPTLVPPAEFPNAVSLWLIVFQLSMIGGPAVAGRLLGSYSPAIVYVINALSFLAVLAALLMMRASGRAEDEEAADKQSGISFSALTEGLRFVWRTPIIVQTMTLDFVATFFASATALLPIFAAEILHVGATGFGILAAAPAAGAVIAAFTMARLGNVRRQGAIVIASVAVYGAATLAFGLSRFFWLSLLMLAVTGAADTVSTVLRQTIRQLVTPNSLRGRMTSVNMIFFMGGPQLGELEAGAVAALIGPTLSVVTGGVGCIIAAALALLYARSLMGYEGQGRRQSAE
ncbi:MAG TPA: MFS transporter [Pyrinomonadaceae bacterium]|nr:MFS transporter [Pyrinomonadaceae bacterium]